ncbi:hypothetical protein [Mycobacterium phage Weirdo19]|uniref:Uncharacterized protein n=1 Tax=Mycobacterium phage Weirdo19 TaxID=2601610 RepID=A0A6M2YSS9_9CAUD|nr:hypothetical protein KDJ11_gp55 [Mycobacterium phage Weirdo19]QEA10823.1 hypothetical protein [Mycobacterium phage Weirdo19]
MIRIYVTEGDNRKWTVTETDGGNGRVLVSSTSQGYERRARAEEIAHRIAPRGNEAVELVVRSRTGAILHRETIHDPSEVAEPRKVMVVARSVARARELAANLGLLTHRPHLVGRRGLQWAGRGIAELDVVILDEHMPALSPRDLASVLPPLTGEVYRLERVQ